MRGGEPGVVLPSEWMCSKEDLFKTEFYQDWIRPQENIAAGGGAIILKDETRMLAFGGNIRLNDEEKLERNWLDTVAILTPHLKQAFEISRAVAGQALELDLLRNGHAANRAAVLLLAENGFSLYANCAGESLLSDGTVLCLDHAGRVGFLDADANAILGLRFKELRNGQLLTAAGFLLKDGEGAPCWTVRMAPFDPSLHDVSPFPLLLGYSRPSLLVTLSPLREKKEHARSFMKQCGCTDAEVAVAFAIADGLALDEIADGRAVSIHTVRNQTKSVMAKMQVHRQADLIRMIDALRAN